MTLKICVIGAGAAGLAAIRHINSSSSLDGIIFEQSPSVGGIWRYSGEIVPNSDVIHNPMYLGLRTNLPKEIMGFLDFPFQKGEASFVSHEEVKEYLHDYADYFQLWNSIQCNKRVTCVKPIFPVEKERGEDHLHKQPKWNVTVEHIQFRTVEIHEFDSVLVCNGHFWKPFMPDIVNIEVFQGEVFHSKDYRSPEIFANKRVVVVGCGPSGVDISLEIAQVATEVIMSLRDPPLKMELPNNILQTCLIKTARRNGFIFEDNQELQCDALLLCTGYKYDFPFLAQECGVIVEKGKLVTPLYRHMIHTKYPTLCFVALPFQCIPFYLSDIQVRYFVKYLEGLIKLPTENEMNEERHKDKSLRKMMGLPHSHSHQLGELQWQYYRTFAEDAGFSDELKPVVRKIYDHIGDLRRRSATVFRNDLVHIIDADTFSCKCTSHILSN